MIVVVKGHDSNDWLRISDQGESVSIIQHSPEALFELFCDFRGSVMNG
jgi:hypothetical protein